MRKESARKRRQDERKPRLDARKIPPKEAELVDGPGLDEQCVIRNFLGKTQNDARKMYPHQGSFLTEDFAYMASAGLRYYLPPAFDYLRDDQSTRDWEFCLGLLCSLSCQARSSQRLAPDVLLLMKMIAQYCNAHREKFDLEEEDELLEEYLRAIDAA